VTEFDGLVADRLREVALAGADRPYDVHGRRLTDEATGEDIVDQ
jgi:hypothetical protein